MFSRIIFSIIIMFIFVNAQSDGLSEYNFNDTLIVDENESVNQASETNIYVENINLTGHIKVMVIVIGFPDRAHSWPKIYNNEYYPKLGAFPDGTLLSDYIDQYGALPVDEWYKPAFEYFFQVHSGGKFTAEAIYVKRSNGEPYLTDNTFQYWINKRGGNTNVVMYDYLEKKYWNEMANEVAYKIYQDNPNAFNNVNMVQITFVGISKNEFHEEHAGFAYPNGIELKNPNNPSQIFYRGPGAVQRSPEPIIHEALHILGDAAGNPHGFKGFPDRGWNKNISYALGDTLLVYHKNLTRSYDIMYHNENIPAQHSLYGTFPMISHDLIFLGWIEPDEIHLINGQNAIGVKLADINYPLTDAQKADGFCRVAKVMIHENHTGEQDEYFLVEFHNATEFDKNFHNLDEGLYNTGVLIWHIKEKVNMVNVYADNLIDLELAVPYNGWYGNPIPDDGYPRDYNRDPSVTGQAYWNGNLAMDYDWLDDVQKKTVFENGKKVDKYYFMPDGGRHLWETTVDESVNNFPWDPTGEKWFMRASSLRSDFFTDEPIKGLVHNMLTDATRPSSKDWNGNLTHIGIVNIRRENNYMVCDVFYNFWDGELTENTTWNGTKIIGPNFKVPAGITLTIEDGTQIEFVKDSRLEVEGSLVINGVVQFKDLIEDNYALNDEKIILNSATIQIPFLGQFIVEENGPTIEVNPGTTFILGDGAEIVVKSQIKAIGTPDNPITFRHIDENPALDDWWRWIRLEGPSNNNSIIEHALIQDARYGIYVYNASPTIRNNTIRDCNYYGIYASNCTPPGFIIKNNLIDWIDSDGMDGIFLYRSSPELYDNTIRNQWYGIICNTYSSPWLGSRINSIRGYNVILNNAYGIRAENYSDPFLGYLEHNIEPYSIGRQTSAPPSNTSILYGGYNSIFSNTQYALYAVNNSDILAQYNWWGSFPPPNSLFYNDASSSIDYSMALTSDPGGGASGTPQQAVSTSGESLISQTQNSLLEKYQLALSLYFSQRYQEALYMFKEIVQNYPGSNEAIKSLKHIANIYFTTQNNELIPYLNSIKSQTENNTLIPVAMDILTGAYIHFNNLMDAIDNCKTIIKNFPHSVHEKIALFDLLNIYIYQDQMDEALNIYQMLLNRYPDDELTKIAADLTKTSTYREIRTNNPAKPPQKINNFSSEEFSCEIRSIYPNPGNPSVQFVLSIPVSAEIIIRIYNVLGQTIRQYHFTASQAGQYTWHWNGTNQYGEIISSGVYIGHVIIRSSKTQQLLFQKSQKITLIK